MERISIRKVFSPGSDHVCGSAFFHLVLGEEKVAEVKIEWANGMWTRPPYEIDWIMVAVKGAAKTWDCIRKTIDFTYGDGLSPPGEDPRFEENVESFFDGLCLMLKNAGIGPG